MLTPKQEQWLAHLSDEATITIVPFDPSAQETFEKVRRKIQSVLGESLVVEHHGATSLGISGQDEIDVYIPVPPDRFGSLVASLVHIFGEPRSHYPLERARFVTTEEGKHIDIFLINEEETGWIECLRFEAYLRSHPEALEAYKQLKESGDGLTVRDYYRRKLEFIASTLSGAEPAK